MLLQKKCAIQNVGFKTLKYMSLIYQLRYQLSFTTVQKENDLLMDLTESFHTALVLVMPRDIFFRMRHRKKEIGRRGRYRCSLRIDAFAKTGSLPKAIPRHFCFALESRA